jgi:hypothetical protein
MCNVLGASARATAPGGASNITASTQFIKTKRETYAYRRFGGGAAPPLVLSLRPL